MDAPAIRECEIGLLEPEESSLRYSSWFLDVRNTRSITGVWENKDRRDFLLAIADSGLLMEIDFLGEPDQVVIRETKLKKTGKNSYTPTEEW